MLVTFDPATDTPERLRALAAERHIDTARWTLLRGSDDDVRTMTLLDAFGALIANTDRHHGNLSLLLQDHRWRLAPAYDMLPMLYAQVNGELVERDFNTRDLHPSAATLAAWPRALELARAFWHSAAGDERISPGFQAIARQNLIHLQAV